ncbi:MAG: acyl-CoA dehydrogenase family protein [Candidatus Nezhaarchaeota archaeon]|nr:acyl-CoA dehydrogenase family protein [Candidatus Nezhaarchaeota archaeon]MCX8142262.1 acyl-CoA dehydrogenase family protein [Candidatus Nezhaarchaeota archaeon]MDW8050765.1 acyl-CoA dehydrogenase family protein [Nitrososphaerota archaeon]
MPFELTEEQLEIKKAVREFCEKEFKPEIALELDRKEEFPLELYRKAAKLGFTSVGMPEEYGGGGYGVLETCLVVEEMCRADSSLGVAITSGTFGSQLIQFFGTKEQKEKYLPPLCRGDYISAAAFTEPNRGSDITRLDTVASKYGGEWWINGTKTFITNAPIADFIIILAQTDTKVRPTYRGQTLFVVDRGTPGLETTKLSNKMGIRCSVTGEVRLDNVKVTDWNIVGELNKGFYHTMQFLDVTRVAVGAQGVGIAQGAWEIAFKYAKQREAFGQPIIQHQLIGCTLAELATKIEAARLLTYRSAWLVDQGKLDPMLTSMAKLYASRVAMEATDFAIQTLGGYGYFAEYRVEKYHRDAKITEIYEGTSEIQKLTILRYLLSKY